MSHVAIRFSFSLALAAMLLSGGEALARPNYFATFTSMYGLTEGEDLYSCGVCHRRWEGTGARNPFGTAVEQQLYLGKTITDAILDVEAADTDGDGTSNVDELTIEGTLPGYSCANYLLVINPPPFFQSIITPGVPSCLEPKDILVDPTTATLIAEVNEINTATVEIRNNGTDDPITVSSYGLLAGAHASLSVTGPATPIVIPVGDSATLEVQFAPTSVVLAGATLRVSSDDPDEADVDITVTGLSFVKNLAPAADRAACYDETRRRFERYSQTHLKEWARCHLDELKGAACDTGRRDLKIAQAAEKLREFVGGARDRKCNGNGVTANRLDLPLTCGAPCESIAVTTISKWADCLVCRQEAATQSALEASMGSSPPDLPANVLGAQEHRCNLKVVKGMQNAVRRIQKAVDQCRLANVTAAVPVDCDATLAAGIAQEAAKLDAVLDRCSSTSDMLGCRFEPMPAPQCLSTAAESIAKDLAGAVFDTAD